MEFLGGYQAGGSVGESAGGSMLGTVGSVVGSAGAGGAQGAIGSGMVNVTRAVSAVAAAASSGGGGGAASGLFRSVTGNGLLAGYPLGFTTGGAPDGDISYSDGGGGGGGGDYASANARLSRSLGAEPYTTAAGCGPRAFVLRGLVVLYFVT